MSYASAREIAKQNGRRVQKGELNTIIEQVTNKNNIDVDEISP